MTKKSLLLFAALSIAALADFGCRPNNPEEPDTPGELQKVTAKVPVTQNWIYEGKPTITIQIENPNKVAVESAVQVRLSTDVKTAVGVLESTVEVPASGTLDVDVTTETELPPGFYRAICKVDGKSAGDFFFGVSPEKIVSAPDKQADFDAYWDAAKAELAAIDMKPNMIEATSQSSAKRKVYLVEFQSVPDQPGGDPVTVRGYYLQPQDHRKHPVIMHFYGYDSSPKTSMYCPSGGSSDYAEFYLSTRGQMINNRASEYRADGIKLDFTNTYGDWFAFQFGNKDGYYYRGAFMDCVQAVRFMAQQATSDMSNLFAEGSSQGGALTYATAALSDYTFSAIAPCVAFLGDFPDYFKIVSWPGEVAKANKGDMTDEQMYAFLSYFDTKNLATRIHCPVIASSCLQDGTCPPHTNLAPYNNLKSTDKEIHFYPLLHHDIPSDWPGKWDAFFKARIK